MACYWKTNVLILELVTSCFIVSECVSVSFSEGTICDVDERIVSGCSKTTSEIRTSSECAIRCGNDSYCYGFSIWNTDQTCYLHHHCPQITGCKLTHSDHFYMSKEQLCYNEGFFNPQTASCQCVNAWVGPTCEEKPKDCGELVTYGYKVGNYRTLLDHDRDGKNFVEVICTLTTTSSHQMIMLLRHEGNIDFNMTWDQFREGYYNDDENYWFGLEAFHTATSILHYDRLIFVVDFGDDGLAYRRYDDFIVNGGSKNFSYTCGRNFENGRGTIQRRGYKLQDCFGPYQNTPFSSWDNDHDEDVSQNCASRAGGGWWFTECNSTCQLFAWNWDYADSKPSYQLLLVPGMPLSGLFSFKSIGIYVQNN